MDALINSLIQVGVFIGAIYLVGFLIALVNRAFYAMVGDSPAMVYGTAFIGTPIHELSHALFCMIFMHRIHEIKLFQVSSEDGTLGYVSHSWNRKNLYATIGNFFIGVAPILVGTSLLVLLMWLITPTTFEGVNAAIFAGGTYQTFFASAKDALIAFFKGVTDWRWWLYLIPVIFIALHMNLSGADLKGTVIAIPFMILVIFGVNFLIWAINKDAYASFVRVASVGGTYLLLLLFMSLVFSLIVLVFGFLIHLIRRAVGR